MLDVLHFNSRLLLVLILVQHLLGFFIDWRLLARIDVAAALFYDCLELGQLVFKFLNAFFDEFLVLFEEFVALAF